MAEKEERIYIDVENDNLDRSKHLSMTRQEAIEKMAKAMAADDMLVPGYYEMAKDALNALLSSGE